MTQFTDRVEKLLDGTEKATQAKERGDLLEDLAAHVLGSIPGVKVTHQDVRNVHGSEEIDLVLFNEQLPDGLEVFAPFLFVECKNKKDPVSSSALREFGYKLKSRNSGFGILFARWGITGDREELTAAQHVISTELREGREIVVITEQDLLQLEDPENVVDLLIRRRSSLVATGGFVQNDGWREEQTPASEVCGKSAEAGDPQGSVDGQAVRDESGIGAAIQREQEQLVREMLERAPRLPDDHAAARELLVDSSNELHRLLEPPAADADQVEHGRRMLEAMLDLGAIASAFLERSGAWERDPADIVTSMHFYAPNIRHVQFSSSLYADTLTYYTLEMLNQEDLSGRIAALALLGLMVESHAELEDGLYELLASPDE